MVGRQREQAFDVSRRHSPTPLFHQAPDLLFIGCHRYKRQREGRIIRVDKRPGDAYARKTVWIAARRSFHRRWPRAADDYYDDTIEVFKKAGQSGNFFAKSYGYAVFPTIGKGGFGVGGAHGNGRVYEKGKLHRRHDDDPGHRRLTGRRPGLQPDHLLRGQARARGVHAGNFEFGAQARPWRSPPERGAAGTAGTGAAQAAASTMPDPGGYHKGMAVFTVAKGGLMYEASIGGQKFRYKPKK